MAKWPSQKLDGCNVWLAARRGSAAIWRICGSRKPFRRIVGNGAAKLAS